MFPNPLVALTSSFPSLSNAIASVFVPPPSIPIIYFIIRSPHFLHIEGYVTFPKTTDFFAPVALGTLLGLR
ncbi:hypothetical protein protein [Bacillus cereus G9241]|nr:hypothetical protein protein [Bacillus cereus G9241]